MKIDDRLLKKSLKAALALSVIKKEGFKEKVRKFDETVDFIRNLKDINLKDPKQRIDKELILIHPLNDGAKVCVVASDEILLQAKKFGADTLDNDGLIKLNQEDKKSKKKFVKKYDFFVVEDKMMRDIARYLARFLGPVGKMPKPFPTGYGIISSGEELENALDRYRRIIRIQVKKQPIVQVKVGKKSMESEKILENLKEIVNYVADQMPHKFNNFKSAFIKTTMGRAIKVDESFLKSTGVL